MAQLLDGLDVVYAADEAAESSDDNTNDSDDDSDASLGSGGVADGHSHTEGDYPNEIDPLGGWVDTGESYRESNGILRKVFTKDVTESFYILYHTTHL